MDIVPDTNTPWIDFLSASKKLHPNFSRGRARKGELNLVGQLESQLLQDLRNGDDSQCAGLRRKHRWLKRMETAGNWIPADAEREFADNPVGMVQTLMLYTDRWLGGRFVGKVGRLLEGNAMRGRNEELRGPRDKLDKYQRHRRYRENVKEVEDRSLRQDAIKKGYENCFFEPALGLPFQGIWLGDRRMRPFPARIVRFAHSHGIRSSVEDPLDCLQELYQRARALREAQLQANITRLQGELSSAIRRRKAAIKKKDGDIKKATERVKETRRVAKKREDRLQTDIARLRGELRHAISKRKAAIKKRDGDFKAATEESRASREREAQLQVDIVRLQGELSNVVSEKETVIKERDRAFKERAERDEVIKKKEGDIAKALKERREREKFIKEKEGDIEGYQVTINRLAYRVLMEGLPRSWRGDNRSNTQKWDDFWVKALKKAKNKAGPIKDLLDNPPPGKTKGDFYKDIERIGGKKLYSKYSDYIHKFTVNKETYEMDPATVSDAVELRILQALKPKNFITGNADWAKERARFI